MKVQDFQLKKSIVSIILYPVSLIYLLINKVDICYRKIKQIKYSKSFVVCVGNVVCGGTGKTPFVLYLHKLLEKEFSICCIHTGYGHSIQKPLFLAKSSNFRNISDEVMLLNQHSDVCVGRDRLSCLRKTNHDMIIMDDGFHDFRIHRDLNFIVFDAKRLTGNGFYLPSGILRTDLSCITKNDIIIVTNSFTKSELKMKFPLNKTIYTCQRLNFDKFSPNQKYLVFSGIGDNSKFQDSVKSYFSNVDFVEYDDHYNYSANDVNYLLEIAKNKNARLLTTAKDYVKIREFYTDVDVLEIELYLHENDEMFIQNVIKEKIKHNL